VGQVISILIQVKLTQVSGFNATIADYGKTNVRFHIEQKARGKRAGLEFTKRHALSRASS